MSDNTPRSSQPQVVYVASEESFTSKAIWTLVLYFVLYIPGLIANFLFWSEARQVEARTGRAPAGAGCLTAMLVVQGIAVALFCVAVALGGLAS